MEERRAKGLCKKPTKEQALANYKQWKERNPEKHKAHRAVARAVRKGKLVKPAYCQHRGCKRVRLEAHHDDYTKPLEVIWLCRRHHAARHKRMSIPEFPFVNFKGAQPIPDTSFNPQEFTDGDNSDIIYAQGRNEDAS
jgi:hypothetical protein